MSDNEGKRAPEDAAIPKEAEPGERDVFAAPTVIGRADSDILALIRAARDGGTRPVTLPPPRPELPTLPAGVIDSAAVVAAASELDAAWETDEPEPPSQRKTAPPPDEPAPDESTEDVAGSVVQASLSPDSAPASPAHAAQAASETAPKTSERTEAPMHAAIDATRTPARATSDETLQVRRPKASGRGWTVPLAIVGGGIAIAAVVAAVLDVC